jgi:formate dehydrogenase subunit gamma
MARVAGLIAAIVFAGLFVATLVGARAPEEAVVPTNGVTAGGPADNPGGTGALGELQARAKMQQWPGQTTQPAPQTQALTLGETGASRSPEQRVAQWLSDKSTNRDILQRPGFVRGRATLPGAERGVLMQPQGRTWRNVHTEKLVYGGGLYIFGVSFLIALFLALRGRIRVDEGESAETVKRFSAFERANHWLTAVSFLLMALTGVIILYGDALIRPWLGAAAYAKLAGISAWSHMTFAVPFVVGVLVMALLWTRQNRFERVDWEWLKRGGGFVGSHAAHAPARKFNAGQKFVFWGVALGGLLLTLTGLGLMFPFFWTGYTGMQIAQSLHAVIALLMIGLIIGHIYIGTIGMEGAFDAMWTGRVDRNWAREHHRLWSEAAVGQQRVTSHSSAVGPLATVASGIVIAVALALIMVQIYERLGISTNERASRPGSSVHLSEISLGK